MNRIWVVEIKVGERWNPTTGVCLSRASGHVELGIWKTNKPNYHFRLNKYVPEKT